MIILVLIVNLTKLDYMTISKNHNKDYEDVMNMKNVDYINELRMHDESQWSLPIKVN